MEARVPSLCASLPGLRSAATPGFYVGASFVEFVPGECGPRVPSYARSPLAVADAPQPAQLIKRRFHALERGRIGLRAARPSQSLSDLLEGELPAYRPFQNVRADLAQRLHRLAIALPVEDLAFRLRHPGIGAEVDGPHATEIDRDQAAGKPGVIPVMAVFLPRRILFGRERAARKGALERGIAHGDLACLAARDVLARAAQSLRRRQRAPLDAHRRAPPARIAQPHVSCSQLSSPAGWWCRRIGLPSFPRLPRSTGAPSRGRR